MLKPRKSKQGEATRERMIDYIKGYHKRHGYMPSYKEISEGAGIQSLSSVNHHMMRLFEDGILETDMEFLAPRGYRLGRGKRRC